MSTGEPVFEVHGAAPPVAAFRAHLRALRRPHGLPTGLVLAGRPFVTPSSPIRIAHLVATRDEDGALADRVLWEVLTDAGYTRWLDGAPRPDLAAIEAALPGLLHLRALHRDGQLDALGLPELAGLLAGRYLSARIVHQLPGIVLPAAAQANALLAVPPGSLPKSPDEGAAPMTTASPDAGNNSWVTGAVEHALAAGYNAHTTTLRGLVRAQLVNRALAAHLPAPPGRVLDLGGGNATQARTLARQGYQVTVLDPDDAMLEQARKHLADDPDDVRARVTLVAGDGHGAAALAGHGFDAVLCHGVLMYVPDPARLLGVLVDVTRPGGVISVVSKNATALALRAGLQGRWHDTLALLADTTGGETGNLGVASRGDDPAAIRRLLDQAGATPVAWHGIRVFTDHLGDTPPDADLDAVVEAEWRAGARDPYRQVARLYHLLHTRR
jgi:ubiquinone/menaquinone biosynthesis C-methylase UbiE